MEKLLSTGGAKGMIRDQIDHLPPAPYIPWGKGGSRRQRLVIVIEGREECDSRAALPPVPFPFFS